ncbi:uncharacterized protein LOC113313258 [Papaver somniferum]|uniref:uncharacterized protein LOC113313258 n=1 Tax=Papaver somniferum TaxID=3469 RepID=UPI000E6FE06C|nr:uncharacterized protein LOC113313258 [Papaver somniferum]XP_026417788.1 uncharacterized protein LOC113313258 [Papaver somniferum]
MASSDSQQSHDTPMESDTSAKGKADIAWQYAREEKHPVTKKRISITCTVCYKKIFGGRINRLKKHLAGQIGEVAPCTKFNQDVRYQMLESLKETSTKKRQREVEGDDQHDSEVQEIEEVEMNKQTSVPINTNRNGASKRVAGVANQKSTGIGGYFAPRTTPGSQPSIRSALASKEVKKQTDLAVATWMFDACITFNAINSYYFQLMLDAFATIDPGYKAPSYDDIHTNLLRAMVKEVQLFVENFRRFWADTGCTVMEDGWKDKINRSLINLLVDCPKGTVFLKSVDASDMVKTGEQVMVTG